MTELEIESLWMTIDERERLVLAPYALPSCATRGRKHAEPPHRDRGPFQRDRDRILHSSAYRRLSGKTQVFTEMGDYHRTRLTHTQEVASIARTLGRALRLNEDLIEALALFHDIGHPPFGHAGEAALNACLASQGGFSHNRFALTLAEQLEQRYYGFPGLNLTYEVLEGQRVRAAKGDTATGDWPLLEVQVVDLADSMTYNAHDCDDAVKLGLVDIEELAEAPLARDCVRQVRARHPEMRGRLLRKSVVHALIDLQVSDALAAARRLLEAAAPASPADVRSLRLELQLSLEVAAQKRALEGFLYQRVYRHPVLASLRFRAQERLKTMFEVLVAEPHRLPEKFERHAEQVGLRRSVGDYLAGMTDRYFNEQYKMAVGEEPLTL